MWKFLNSEVHSQILFLFRFIYLYTLILLYSNERKCQLAVKHGRNVVAYGTIVSEGGPNVMLHNVSLGEGNFKVSVDVVLDEGAKLPIPVKSGPTIVIVQLEQLLVGLKS